MRPYLRRAAMRAGGQFPSFLMGWEPQGGVTVGNSQQTKEPFLLQALVKRPSGVKISRGL